MYDIEEEPKCGQRGKKMTIATAVSKVMPLAMAIQNYWEKELPRRHPNYPLVDPNVDDGPPPPETQLLREFLERLPEETLYRLGLIISPGRARFDTSRLESRYHELRDEYDVSSCIAWVLDNIHLADDLEYGMEILSEKGIDLDKLDLTLAGA